MEPVGEVGDRRVRAAELLEDPATRGVRQRRKSGIELRFRTLNHLVHYIPAVRPLVNLRRSADPGRVPDVPVRVRPAACRRRCWGPCCVQGCRMRAAQSCATYKGRMRCRSGSLRWAPMVRSMCRERHSRTVERVVPQSSSTWPRPRGRRPRCATSGGWLGRFCLVLSSIGGWRGCPGYTAAVTARGAAAVLTAPLGHAGTVRSRTPANMTPASAGIGAVSLATLPATTKRRWSAVSTIQAVVSTPGSEPPLNPT